MQDYENIILLKGLYTTNNLFVEFHNSFGMFRYHLEVNLISLQLRVRISQPRFSNV